MCSGGIFGGGNAWMKNHQGILDHAQNLHYDHYLQSIGKSLPSAVDPNNYTQAEKEAWISSMNDFNAWKAKNVPLEASGKAWWQTYPAANPPGGESPPPSSGGNNPPPGGGNNPPPGPPDRGPYPKPNKYFPLLTTKYTRPAARNFKRFMQAWDPIGSAEPVVNRSPTDRYGNPFSIYDGLLYQPWSQKYAQKYGLKKNISQYTPNIFGVGKVKYIAPPFGALNITPPEEIFAGPEEEPEDGGPESRK